MAGDSLHVASTFAMATTITISVPIDEASAGSGAITRALDVFHEVQSECTRFDPASPLSRANATPRRRHRLPGYLYAALREAYDAYRDSEGLFDPRVITHLTSMGYDGSLRFDPSASTPRVHGEFGPPLHQVWRPEFKDARRDAWLGEAVDLGGIGKGLAVRWASDVLDGAFSSFIVEAGGDCYLKGVAPDGQPWRVGVEDPRGGESPVAVLAIDSRAVATSSIRRRRWKLGDDQVHHLIDPRSGRPGGTGLLSVTVVGPDPARAEVASKVLFLAGLSGVASAARRHSWAALWCDTSGRVETSTAMSPYVVWEEARA